jgi:hypothetical protein
MIRIRLRSPCDPATCRQSWMGEAVDATDCDSNAPRGFAGIGSGVPVRVTSLDGRYQASGLLTREGVPLAGDDMSTAIGVCIYRMTTTFKDIALVPFSPGSVTSPPLEVKVSMPDRDLGAQELLLVTAGYYVVVPLGIRLD